MSKIELTFAFRWDHTDRLWLQIWLTYEKKDTSLALARFMQFLYANEDNLTEKEQEFCFSLAKLVKKVEFEGESIFAIPHDYDMALFFKKVIDLDLTVMWKRESTVVTLQKNKPLPIDVTLNTRGNALVASMPRRQSFIENPLQFMIFRTQDECFCFSQGTIQNNFPGELETFLLEFLDNDKVNYQEKDIVHFLNTLYKPNRNRIDWNVQADFTSILPQETTPTAVLNVHYEHNVLQPTLAYKYATELIETNHESDTVMEKKTGKRHQRMPDMEGIYQNDLMTLFNEYKLPFLLENPGDIAVFLDKIIPTLENRSWEVHSNVPDFKVHPDAVDIEFKISSSGQDWFYFEPTASVLDQNLSLQEIAALMVQNQGYVKTKKGFIKLTKSSQENLKNLANSGAFKTGKTFKKLDLLPLLQNVKSSGNSTEAKTFLKSLDDSKRVQNCVIPDTFHGTLRAYQQYGVNWMNFLKEIHGGGILADDMGLGKTVQVLAFITQLRPTKPILVIGPTNVVYNWESEIKKFAPSYSSLIYSGSNRETLQKKAKDANIIITSFGLIKNDIDFFTSIDFAAIFIDEAQYIKNPKAQVSKAVKCLHTDFRLAMTGTPIENHIDDLFSIFDFAMPQYLGTHREFEHEAKGNRVKQKVAPFILRREKQDVLDSLPEKTEIVLSCPLSDTQMKLYKTVLDATKKGIKSASGKKEKLSILTAILKLRQMCTHPSLIKEFKDSGFESAKFELLKEKIQELVEENHKVVVFSQFTGMLDIAEKWLKQEMIYYERIDGSVTGRKRQDAVTRFQESTRPGVFIISLKAGGVGINLTAADYVIHLEPWWNPAVEAQATDRVHRMGQKNKVMVYKFIAKGTLEEKIQELQAEKRKLLTQIVDIDSVDDKQINFNEIKDLILS
jgi:SNF2 family DNA or RNA helicase